MRSCDTATDDDDDAAAFCHKTALPLPLSLSLSLLHVLFPLSRFLGSIAVLLSHTLQQNRRNNPIGSYANFKVLVSGNQIALTVINLQCILMHCHLSPPAPPPIHAHSTYSTCSNTLAISSEAEGGRTCHLPYLHVIHYLHINISPLPPSPPPA